MSIREKYESLFYVIRNIKEALKINYILIFKKKNWKSILQKNKKLKNIHKGERCFILGNGPSIREVDFSLLTNEFVFTVNQISKHKDYKKLCSNYHFWADAGFFNLDLSKPEDYEVLETMRNVVTGDNKTVCFYPIEHVDFVKNNELDKITESHFFLSAKDFHAFYNRSIDYTGNTPGFGTVVQWCITMAIYMGFNEIYLLGCDSTSLINNIKATADRIDCEGYGYNVTANEIKRYTHIMSNYSLIKSVDSYSKSLKDYKYLCEYCLKRNIKLVNLTTTTAIDSIPRNTLENVLHAEK